MYIHICVRLTSGLRHMLKQRKQFLRNARARDTRHHVYFRSIIDLGTSHTTTHLEVIVGNPGCWSTRAEIMPLLSLIITNVITDQISNYRRIFLESQTELIN